MSIIQCEDCGQMISDQAENCPHCGGPIAKTTECPECGQTVSSPSGICPICGCPLKNAKGNQGDAIIKWIKKNKWIWWVPIALLALVGIIIGCSHLTSSQDEDEEEIEEQAEDKARNAYKIIIYDDGSGEFLAPDGGRICGIGRENLSSSSRYFYLGKNVEILGESTNCLEITDGRLSAADNILEGMINIYTGKPEHDKKSVAVRTEKKDSQTEYYFRLNEDLIGNYKTTTVDLSEFSDEDYIMVMYDDNLGDLFGPGKKRLCGIKENGDNWDIHRAEYEWRFNKQQNILDKITTSLSVNKGYLYYSTADAKMEDEIYSYRRQVDKRVAEVKVQLQGEATIISFPNKRLESYGTEITSSSHYYY